MNVRDKIRIGFLPMVVGVTLAVSGIAMTPAAHAAWPNHPIKFIIPFGAGGGADIEGRVLAKQMSEILKVPFVPVNMPGAGGARAYTYTKNAKPNGYTVVWTSTSLLTTTNIGNVPFKYDALDNLGRVEYQPLPFAVNTNSKWHTFKQFVSACHQNPGTFKVANSGTGSSTDIAAIALMTAAKCNVIELPVGIKRRNATLLSGESDAMDAPLTGAIRLAQAKRIRLLVIPSEQRDRLIPKVPTAKQLGYPVVVEFFRGLAVPKGTPLSIKKKLERAMVAAAHSKPFRHLAKTDGFTIAPLTGTRFKKMLAKDNRTVVDIMKEAGLFHSKRKK